MRYKALIYSFFLLSVLLLLPNHAFAQTTSLDVTVSPTSFDLTAKPGDTITNKFRVHNNTPASLQLTVEVTKLGPNKAGELVIQDATPEDQYISWLKVDKSITALPNEWTTVPFSITIPQDAAFGYYYTISIKKDAGTSGGNAASVTGAAAIPVLLNVKKDGAVFKAQVTDFRANSFVNEYLPVTFTTTVENQGNIHIRPHGNIFIRSFGQKDLDILDVNQGMGAILPQAKRSYVASWDSGFLVRKPVLKDNGDPEVDSKGNPISKLTINWNKLTDFRFGRYTATLILVYDNGVRDETLQASTNFWVIPYTALAVIIGGLIIVILLLRFLLRSYIRKQLQKMR